MKRLLIGTLALAVLGAHAELKDKIYKYMPLQKDLSVYSANGAVSMEAVFKRNSTALTPDFQEVGTNIPRFWNSGLLMEHGGKDKERGAVNILPADGSIFTPAGKKTAGIYKDGFAFSGSWKLNPVKLVPMLSGKHTFSFYAKGKGTLKVTGILKLKASGSEKTLPAETFVLTGEWKRYFIKFDGGTAKKPDAFAESFRADFQGENVVISAPMLEGPGVYPNPDGPTTYVAPGAHRDADRFFLPGLKPEMGVAGAIAFSYTPAVKCGWNDLFSTDGGWRPEISCTYNIYNKTAYRYQVAFRGKQLWTKNAEFEPGKTYQIVVNWDKDKFAIWVDGKKLGEVAAPGKPFTKKQIYIGSRTIQASANGVFRNFTLFDQTLTDAEIQEFSKDPDLSKKLPKKEVSCLTPFASSPSTRG